MTVIEERTARLMVEGVWATEIRPRDANAPRPKYLIHAENDGEAGRIAGHLMGKAKAIGYNRFRLEQPVAHSVPALGAHASLPDADWPALMAAHALSEAAFEATLQTAVVAPGANRG